MSFYFPYHVQESIFLLQGHHAPPPLTAVTGLIYTPALPLTTPWNCVPLHQAFYYAVTRIQFKVIFHGTKPCPGRPPGFWTASTNAAYHVAPDRSTILANLSFWAKQKGLVDRVFAGQAKFYLTSSMTSTLTILPEAGPQDPQDLIKTIAMSENPETTFFQQQLEEIRTRRLGAFLVVDVDLYDTFDPPPVVDDAQGGTDPASPTVGHTPS